MTPTSDPTEARRGLQGAPGKVLLPLMGELLEATILLPLEHKLGSKLLPHHCKAEIEPASA